MSRPAGRPSRDNRVILPDEILSAALAILDTQGAEAFTMRALATKLHINPMTIYHYFGDRDGLIAALAEKVYQEVFPSPTGDPLPRLAGLLRAYHSQVLQHPGLTLLIFSRPTVFPEQARRITADITQLLQQSGLPSAGARLWVDIIVDFTHGAALATAAGAHSAIERNAAAKNYAEALAELLSALKKRQ
ncbi:transcriptional regulator BetI [Serratia rubidaea]|uniref:Transcriptional regulator BetI n=1 Tax=Serratia rubidaea TaxID=61652 RepID=A0A4U9HSP6_SERRU|nr:TetR/AcrR family transcriptional regulator [Serratia rubidaea]MCR0997019.1 TetR/AcrR family transcriptional regulator [Serratia rubidaea]QPR64465.1 TetR/AcrR family transcriptional regulator [Serratia rubidaea]CAI1038557.1 transcriptional regulator BetI [Serratia rubidaea]CAI1872276.1 transcriptional regulator BetI [Serratia rubidaea]VTP67528.1 transcriptional regulator BetI [Serratia rubidaea]